jgi:hypothetical protein
VLTSPYHLVDPAVLPLARGLRDRGLFADVQVLSVCGDPDVRLVACRKNGDLAVELLASTAGSPTPDHWHAVQVRGEDRQVWQGPPHDAPPCEVVDFVEALLAGRAPRVPYHLLS